MKVDRKKSITKFLAAILLLIGSLQIVSYLFNFETLRGFSRLTAASPLPLVFSHFRGLETFSSRFEIVASDRAQILYRIPITPEFYTALKGPYNRRNVYGAAIAYGPVFFLTEEKLLLEAVLSFALCRGGVLWTMLEKSYDMSQVQNLTIVVSPQSYRVQPEKAESAYFTLTAKCEA